MSRMIVAGLDIGTTKVCVLLAQVFRSSVNIISVGEAASEGLNRGLVANINRTAAAINAAMNKALEDAELSEDEIQNMRIFAGVAGEHINAMKHINYVTIRNDEHEITLDDLERLRADIKLIEHPADRKILHIIPIEYIIDGVKGFDDPIGNTGKKLEATNHIVFAATAALNNIKRSVERAGYNVADYKLQPIASSLSVLDENERDLGVCMIDIGGGTTDIAVFINKSIRDTSVIGIAGNQVTSDIRETLSIVTSEAERIKKQYGFATEEAIIKPDEEIFINRTGGRGMVKIPITLLTQIIRARMKELFELIDRDLKKKGLKDKLTSGIVLTGGGSLLRGCDELAAAVFGLPTRIGLPMDESGKVARPEYATVAGLILPFPGSSYGFKEEFPEESLFIKSKETKAPKTEKQKKEKSKAKQLTENIKIPNDFAEKMQGLIKRIKDFLNDI
ncbi:MAG TPA: cell division protein FtsA [Melioribacteraceae bacterium]|nr:cell division protein FtsA [Melioribacteraceae bacterium]